MAKLYFNYSAMNAGKSTIFNMISRFYDPAEGDIFFQGQSILKKSSHEISHPCFP